MEENKNENVEVKEEKQNERLDKIQLTALITSIVGMVLGLFSALLKGTYSVIAFPLAIIGLCFSIKSIKDDKKNTATLAAFIMSIIGASLALIGLLIFTLFYYQTTSHFTSSIF